MAGRDLTEYMSNILNDIGLNLGNSGTGREIARDIKEKLCYVALNPEEEEKIY